MRGSRLRRRVDRVVPLVSAIPYAVPDMAVCVSAAWRAIPGIAPAASLNKDVDLATDVHNSLMVGSSLIVITRRTSSRIVTPRTQILAVRVAQRGLQLLPKIGVQVVNVRWNQSQSEGRPVAGEHEPVVMVLSYEGLRDDNHTGGGPNATESIRLDRGAICMHRRRANGGALAADSRPLDTRISSSCNSFID